MFSFGRVASVGSRRPIETEQVWGEPEKCAELKVLCEFADGDNCKADLCEKILTSYFLEGTGE